MNKIYNHEDLVEINLLKMNLDFLRRDFIINNSSEILILYNICEILVRLSKKFLIKQEILQDVNKYRQKIAHSKVLPNNFNEIIREEYLNLLDEFKHSSLEIEDIIFSKLNKKYEFIEDSLIMDILNEHNIECNKLYRLKCIPEHPRFNDERNYLLFNEKDMTDEEIENIMNIFHTKMPKVLFMRKFYKIKNNKNTSMEWY